MAEEKKVEHKHYAPEDISRKNRTVALILCTFFGWLGLHRFYVDKLGTGLTMMFTFGGFGIWYFIDFIWLIAGTFEDKEGRLLHNWY